LLPFPRMSTPPLHDFLEVLAQALKRPLLPVKEAAAELRMTAADPNSQRMGEVILRHISQMDRTIQAVLDLSHLQRGRFQTERTEVELLRILEAAVEECRPTLESKGQRLIVKMPDEPLRVMGDEPRLLQVMHTLMENAVKFTPEAGSIGLSLAPVGADAEVQVQDTGCGVSPTIMSRMFDPFAIASSKDSSDEGLGLSLSVAKHIVELHGGSLSAHSEGPGQGALFSVRLPLA
jgi:signal transduction histidine kinase